MEKLFVAFIFFSMIPPSVIAEEVNNIRNNTQQTTQNSDALNFGNFNNQQPQYISKNTNHIVFYGNNNNPNKIGGEYIVFQVQNNIAQGLVYVQNSDVFSCFQGNYNSQNKSLQQLIFAYPDMESGVWIKSSSDESLPLTDYPYTLNYNQISEGANNLLKECFNQF